MKNRLRIAFFGSSLVSCYWNGAATYYRGILRALAERGHRIQFFEPDAYDRQQHRDIPDPDWAQVTVYEAGSEGAVLRAVEQGKNADLVVKASGVGVHDELLEAAVLELQTPGRRVVFWDVDAPATLDRVTQNTADPFRPLIARYDLVFTYGGGPRVASAYEALGARECVPVYNALDATTHFRVQPDPRYSADLGFLGNRLPDRERRVDAFFLEAARRLPSQTFLLGGAGWEDKALPANVRYVGHVSTRDHNGFNSTPRTVLNVNRASMASYGFSPPTRVFEAAGAGACLITDDWEGIELFLEPNVEVLVARNGDEVAAHLQRVTSTHASLIGAAALRRVLAEHTYTHRAERVEGVLEGRFHLTEARV
jgi:spore maturation protein CgeB